MIKVKTAKLAEANTKFDKAKGDKELYEDELNTAKSDETAATASREEAWTQAGFDPKSDEFNKDPNAAGDHDHDGAKGGKDGSGQGASGDGKGSSGDASNQGSDGKNGGK